MVCIWHNGMGQWTSALSMSVNEETATVDWTNKCGFFLALALFKSFWSSFELDLLEVTSDLWKLWEIKTAKIHFLNYLKRWRMVANRSFNFGCSPRFHVNCLLFFVIQSVGKCVRWLGWPRDRTLDNSFFVHECLSQSFIPISTLPH